MKNLLCLFFLSLVGSCQSAEKESAIKERATFKDGLAERLEKSNSSDALTSVHKEIEKLYISADFLSSQERCELDLLKAKRDELVVQYAIIKAEQKD